MKTRILSKVQREGCRFEDIVYVHASRKQKKKNRSTKYEYCKSNQNLDAIAISCFLFLSVRWEGRKSRQKLAN